MVRENRPIVIFILLVVCLSSCVETETNRTTRKVDASKVQVYEIDMNKPRLRLALDVPEEIEANIQNMLFVEVDDGERRYGFGGNVFVADSVRSDALLYSPWINTPDTGDIVVSFRLAYETGANIVDDRVTAGLRPGRLCEIEFGISDHDPCGEWTDVEICRTYSLPRDVESSGDGQLYFAWRWYPIAESGQE